MSITVSRKDNTGSLVQGTPQRKKLITFGTPGDTSTSKDSSLFSTPKPPSAFPGRSPRVTSEFSTPRSDAAGGGSPTGTTRNRRRSVLPTLLKPEQEDQDDDSLSDDEYVYVPSQQQEEQRKKKKKKTMEAEEQLTTVRTLVFPGYGTTPSTPCSATSAKESSKKRMRGVVLHPETPTTASGGGGGDDYTIEEFWICDSAQYRLGSEEIEHTVHHIVRQESLPFQGKFTTHVQKLTQSNEFLNLVRCFFWFGVFHLKDRYFPAEKKSWERDEKHLFHGISMSYGRLFDSVKLIHNDSPAMFIEHQDSVLSPLPTILSKVAFYFLTSEFVSVEDERKFDSKVRYHIGKHCHLWLTGVAPQRLDLKGWPRKELQRRVKKMKKQFSAQAMSLALDSVADAATTRHHQQSPAMPLLTVSSARTVAEDAKVHSGGSGSPKEGASSSTARGIRTTSHHQHRNKLTVLPTHVTQDRWFERDRFLGHVCAERHSDGMGKVAQKSMQRFSPAMLHYFEQQHLEAKAIPGGRTVMNWTSLSKIDRQGGRIAFSHSSEGSMARTRRMMQEDTRQREAVAGNDRRDVVLAHRASRFWEGKATVARRQLVKLYSKKNEEHDSIRDALRRTLLAAIAETSSNIFENISRHVEALQMAQRHVFDIPLPYRTEFHTLSARCYAKLKSLQRQLPALAEMQSASERFGETILFSEENLAALTEAFEWLQQRQEQQNVRSAGGIATPQKQQPQPSTVFDATTRAVVGGGERDETLGRREMTTALMTAANGEGGEFIGDSEAGADPVDEFLNTVAPQYGSVDFRMRNIEVDDGLIWHRLRETHHPTTGRERRRGTATTAIDDSQYGGIGTLDGTFGVGGRRSIFDDPALGSTTEDDEEEQEQEQTEDDVSPKLDSPVISARRPTLEPRRPTLEPRERRLASSTASVVAQEWEGNQGSRQPFYITETNTDIPSSVPYSAYRCDAAEDDGDRHHRDSTCSGGSLLTSSAHSPSPNRDLHSRHRVGFGTRSPRPASRQRWDESRPLDQILPRITPQRTKQGAR